MPQFEVEEVGPNRASGLFRARTAEEAVRGAAGVAPEEEVEVDAVADLHGWSEVRVGGASSGRVRAHQRMRFRRD